MELPSKMFEIPLDMVKVESFKRCLCGLRKINDTSSWKPALTYYMRNVRKFTRLWAHWRLWQTFSLALVVFPSFSRIYPLSLRVVIYRLINNLSASSSTVFCCQDFFQIIEQSLSPYNPSYRKLGLHQVIISSSRGSTCSPGFIPLCETGWHYINICTCVFLWKWMSGCGIFTRPFVMALSRNSYI